MTNHKPQTSLRTVRAPRRKNKNRVFLNPEMGRSHTREEIAEAWGCSPQRIAQIEAAAIRKLRIAFGLLRPMKIKSSGKKPNTIYLNDPTPESEEWREALFGLRLKKDFNPLNDTRTLLPI